jgi:tetratricopeptide (TPR) repeat protein
MRKQPVITSEERKMKFAEAGVLFVLVLALTIFVGVRVASRDGQDGEIEIAQAAVETVAPETAITTAQDESPADTPAEIMTEVGAAETDATLAAAPPRAVTYAEAELSYFDGAYVEAADLFDAYTAEHPANAWGFFMLGLSEWKSGDLDASEEAFSAALDIKPDHVKSLINYSRVLLELERPDDARAQIELALAQEPMNVDANRMFSRINYSAGRYDEAVAGYLKVLQIDSDDVWSLNNLGLIRIEQERFAEALPPLAKAAELDSSIACIQNNLGVALERTGHYTAAVEAFALALAADANYTKADESRARVSSLTEAADLEAIDLIAVAASFSAFPTVTAIEAMEAEIMDVPGDMEVATHQADKNDADDQ